MLKGICKCVSLRLIVLLISTVICTCLLYCSRANKMMMMMMKCSGCHVYTVQTCNESSDPATKRKVSDSSNIRPEVGCLCFLRVCSEIIPKTSKNILNFPRFTVNRCKRGLRCQNFMTKLEISQQFVVVFPNPSFEDVSWTVVVYDYLCLRPG